MRVLQASGGPDFPLEAFWTECGGEVWMHDLQRNWAVVPEIVGQEYRGHATAPKLLFDAVAISQLVPESLADVCHYMTCFEGWGTPSIPPGPIDG
jgi:hypothetical protein